MATNPTGCWRTHGRTSTTSTGPTARNSLLISTTIVIYRFMYPTCRDMAVLLWWKISIMRDMECSCRCPSWVSICTSLRKLILIIRNIISIFMELLTRLLYWVFRSLWPVMDFWIARIIGRLLFRSTMRTIREYYLYITISKNPSYCIK